MQNVKNELKNNNNHSALKEIKLKLNIGGSIYFEEFGNQEEDERIKVFDSTERYLTYLSVETLAYDAECCDASIKELLNRECEKYSKAKDINELLHLLGIESVKASRDWKDLIEDAAAFCSNEDKEKAHTLTKEEFLNNEYINQIGDYFVIQTDF